MLKRIFTALISLVLWAPALFAQVPSPLIFSRVTKKDGLASSMTFQTIRDKQGYLWIATQNGLQRYDGNRFLTFRHRPGDSTSIAENSINKLFIDKKNRLWLLFDNQLGIFNTANFTFSSAKISSPVGMVRKLLEDLEGRVVLLADSKQLLYDESQHAFVTAFPLPALPAGFTITDMAVNTTNGSYWFTGKQGSLLYDPKTKHTDYKEQNNIVDQELDSFISVKNAKYPFVASDGSFWMVNWIPFTAAPPVLYNYDNRSHKLLSFEKIRAYKADSYYEIWNVFQQSNGTIWIYGIGLLAYYNPADNRFVYINSDPFRENGIDYDLVSHLYEDSEKNVWVCTNKGLYRFNAEAQVFQNIFNKRPNDTTVVQNAVSAIVQTQNNEIWVATWGAGVFSYDKNFQPIPNPLIAFNPVNKNLHASYMIQRKNAEIWIGTQPGELEIHNPVDGKTYVVVNGVLKGQTISQLLEDRDGDVWIGSNSGSLVKCEKGLWNDSTAFKTIMADISDIMKLYEDNNGHLWICTAGNGVYEIDPNTGKTFNQYTETGNKNDGLLNDGATDVVQYNDSLYLIASNELCLLNKKNNTFTYLTAADGLPAEHITALLVDKQKRIWVTQDGGLYRLNIDKKLAISYGAAEGITDDIFQVSSGTVLSDGRIALGTPHNFLVFDPEKTINKTAIPPVNITGFILNSKYLSVDSIRQLEELVLPYDNTFINIQLSTLSFRRTFYMYYMLEGLDKTWKRVYNNEITYQYLPPGNYTLKLKSANGDGIETKTTTSLKIHITPPFWKTWWFYCLLTLFIGGILFLLDHRWMKRREAILKMRSNIADGLHQEISAALGNITILSEMAKMKAGEEPQKSKEFIDQIHTKSQNMTIAMDDLLWSIDPNNDSMENFLLRYREYIDALKNRNNVNIDLLVDKNVDKVNLTMKMRNDVYWLFKGGITNVVKTGAVNCNIHIAYEKPDLIYTLEFDMSNMNIEQFHNLRQRKELADKLEDVGATLNFKEHRPKGIFVLKIPVKAGGL